MSKLSPELGSFFEKMAETVRSRDGEVITTNTAKAVLQENQHSEVTVRDFTLTQDEPTSVLGTAKGPTPTDFFISSVALCENVIFVRNAAMANLPIDSLETTASGKWNMKGLWEIGGADASFREIDVETKVQTGASASEVVKVAEQTHRRCPIYATLRKSLTISFKLEINGTEVLLTQDR